MDGWHACLLSTIQKGRLRVVLVMELCREEEEVRHARGGRERRGAKGGRRPCLRRHGKEKEGGDRNIRARPRKGEGENSFGARTLFPPPLP